MSAPDFETPGRAIHPFLHRRIAGFRRKRQATKLLSRTFRHGLTAGFTPAGGDARVFEYFPRLPPLPRLWLYVTLLNHWPLAGPSGSHLLEGLNAFLGANLARLTVFGEKRC